MIGRGRGESERGTNTKPVWSSTFHCGSFDHQSLSKADASLDFPIGTCKSAFDVLAKDKALEKVLVFKTSHERKTWINEMAKRLRGIIGPLVKYIGKSNKCPKWVLNLGLKQMGKTPAQPLDGVDDEQNE